MFIVNQKTVVKITKKKDFSSFRYNAKDLAKIVFLKTRTSVL